MEDGPGALVVSTVVGMGVDGMAIGVTLLVDPTGLTRELFVKDPVPIGTEAVDVPFHIPGSDRVTVD